MRFKLLFGIVLCVNASCLASATPIEKAAPSAVQQERGVSAKLPTDTGMGRPDPDGQVAVKQGDQTPKKTFWQLVMSGDPPALGVLFQALIGIGTVFIGIVAFRLNANTRKGQVDHEHVLMVLDIDKALMESPELISMYGKRYMPETRGAVEKASAQPVQEKGTVRLKEIKEESFFLLHANMFEYVYDYYGTKPKWLLGRYDKEKWEAWQIYIKCFMTVYNPKTRDYWNENRDVYTKSFQKFIETIYKPDDRK